MVDIKKVAFLGMGVMGFPMAGHLSAKGYDVVVYNRTASKAESWVAKHGGLSAPTPREAAQDRHIVFACVGNDNDVRDVVIGTDGAFSGMGEGAIFVDHTTASANLALELDKIANTKGIGFFGCSCVGRSGRGRKWCADGDVWRRPKNLRRRKADNGHLFPGSYTYGRRRSWPANKDGQSNLYWLAHCLQIQKGNAD